MEAQIQKEKDRNSKLLKKREELSKELLKMKSTVKELKYERNFLLNVMMNGGDYKETLPAAVDEASHEVEEELDELEED